MTLDPTLAPHGACENEGAAPGEEAAPEQSNSSTDGTPKSGLVHVKEALAEANPTIRVGVALAREDSLRALWRFARLDGRDVELAAFGCGKWVPDGRRAPIRGMGLAYAASVERAISVIVEIGGDGGTAADGASSSLLGCTGYYVVPAVLRDGVAARYEAGKWSAASEGTAKEADVVRSNVLSVDCDPERPSATNGSNREVARSLAVGWRVRRALITAGAPETALAYGCSGNGCQVLIALDVPWSPEVKTLRKRVLWALGAIHDLLDGTGAPLVTVDQAMADGARYIPAFGTAKRKGPNHGDRVQRRTWLVAPDAVAPLDLAGLAALADALEAAIPAERLGRWEELKGTRKPVATPSGAKAAASSPAKNKEAWKAWWDAVRAVPIAEVMAWLGLSGCPGCDATRGADNLTRKGIHLFKCHHPACLNKGLGEGRYDTVALVKEARSLAERREAARLIADHWGIPTPERKKGRPKASLTVEEAAKLAEAAGVTPPTGAGVPAESTAVSHALTDLGNARRLVANYGDDIRYVRSWNKWYVWSGRHWEPDDLVVLERHAHSTAEGIFGEALTVEGDEERAEVVKWAQASQSRRATDAMIKQAEEMRAVRVDAFDGSGTEYILNCQNGVVDLRTGALREHRREDMITRLAGVSYEPYDPAKAPLWEAFLARVQPDEEQRTFLQRATGHSVIGEVLDHIILIHHGGGRNGKGVFFESLLHALGSYAGVIPEELLLEKQGEHPAIYSTLYGVRLAVAAETDQRGALACARMKRLSGGDTIPVRRMREDWWEFRPVARIHVHTNHLPRVPDDTHAMWARLLLVDWAVTIPPEEIDPRLGAKLREEAPQILGWVVAGVKEYLRLGLAIPKVVEQATAAWRQNEDVLGQFLDEVCNTERNGTPITVEKGELYKAYTEWCGEAGHPPKGKVTFGKDLQRRLGLTEEREPGTGRRLWVGICLRAGQSPVFLADPFPEYADI